MNRRIKSKHIKIILSNNLNIKHIAERKYIDQCDTCTIEQIEGYNCRSECYPEWKIVYLFQCQDLIKSIRNIIGLDFNICEFDCNTNIPKYMTIFKYLLMENKIRGFDIIFYDGDAIEKDYLQVVRYKFKKRKI